MSLKNQVEAILFALGKNIHIEEICKLVGADKKKVKKALKELYDDYEKREGAIMLTGSEDVWKFNIREKYLYLVKDLISETDLERPTMETLSVIAFKQPALQSDVIKKRGVGAYEHIKELEEAAFITRERWGRSKRIRLTPKFYEYFELDKAQVKELFNQFEEVDEGVSDAEKELADKLEARYAEEEKLKKERAEMQEKKLPYHERMSKVEDDIQVELEEPEEEPEEEEEKPKKGKKVESKENNVSKKKNSKKEDKD